ncbi:MAG: GNAT family N-acetyltransferase [Planctomycetes bacterium]|nr:GNAT family N-acetyltransferase [Planctomycetota bacterium]
MNIREINSIDDLAELKSTWGELLAQTPRANYFQSFDWLCVYWKHSRADQRLKVLVVEDCGNVVGILPLVVRQELTKVGKIRFLTYPLDFWGSFYGPIGPCPGQIFAAAFDYLSTTSRNFDVLELRWVEGGPEASDLIEASLETAHFAPQRSQLESIAVVDLSGSWEDYFASRTSKWRNSYRRWKRQLSTIGKITHVRFRPDASVAPQWDYYDECLRIAAASWQGSSKTGTTLTHNEVASFLRETHEVAAQSGCVDINLLYIDDRAVAFAYNYVYQGYVFGLRAGYDPTLPVKGAGNLLYPMAIEDSFRRGDWRYDLGPGYLKSKRALLTDVLPTYRISCYKQWSVRQQLMRWKRKIDARPETQIISIESPVVSVPMVDQP